MIAFLSSFGVITLLMVLVVFDVVIVVGVFVAKGVVAILFVCSLIGKLSFFANKEYFSISRT